MKLSQRYHLPTDEAMRRRDGGDDDTAEDFSRAMAAMAPWGESTGRPAAAAAAATWCQGAPDAGTPPEQMPVPRWAGGSSNHHPPRRRPGSGQEHEFDGRLQPQEPPWPCESPQGTFAPVQSREAGGQGPPLPSAWMTRNTSSGMGPGAFADEVDDEFSSEVGRRERQEALLFQLAQDLDQPQTAWHGSEQGRANYQAPRGREVDFAHRTGEDPFRGGGPPQTFAGQDVRHRQEWRLSQEQYFASDEHLPPHMQLPEPQRQMGHRSGDEFSIPEPSFLAAPEAAHLQAAMQLQAEQWHAAQAAQMHFQAEQLQREQEEQWRRQEEHRLLQEQRVFADQQEEERRRREEQRRFQEREDEERRLESERRREMQLQMEEAARRRREEEEEALQAQMRRAQEICRRKIAEDARLAAEEDRIRREEEAEAQRREEQHRAALRAEAQRQEEDRRRREEEQVLQMQQRAQEMGRRAEEARVAEQERRRREQEEEARVAEQERRLREQHEQFERQQQEAEEFSARAKVEEETSRRAEEEEECHRQVLAAEEARRREEEAEEETDEEDSAPPAASEAAGEAGLDDPNLLPRSHYEVLEVQHDVSADDVRKAYKRQCIRHHPDKGGSRARFDEISRAYTVLSDPHLRQAYDDRGDAGVEEVENTARDAAGASAAAAEGSTSEAQSQPIVTQCSIPLEVAFLGGSVEVPLVRIVACQTCSGSGVAPGSCVVECHGCSGAGELVQMVQLGPMLVEQRGLCGICSGSGKLLPSTSLCPQCGGEQLVEEQACKNFEIPPGVAPSERIVAPGEGHSLPGLAAGDVVLVCNVDHHERFVRKGDDLLAEHKVPLKVALCGGAFEVPHLGGKSVRVRMARGTVLAPGTVKCLPGEGMPKRHNPHLRGDLVLRFSVEFPVALPEDVAARLESVLQGCPGQPESVEESEANGEEVYLADFDIDEFGQTLQAQQQEYEAEHCTQRGSDGTWHQEFSAHPHNEAASCRQM